MTEAAQQMTWHKKDVRYNPDKMVHPSDGESWKNFDRIHREKLPSVHNPPPRYNAGDNESSLSIFRGQLGSASDARYKTLNHEEWRHIMLYLLTNLSEVEPYIG